MSARRWHAANPSDLRLPVGIVLAISMLTNGCHFSGARAEPAIQFTKLPIAGEGTALKLDSIEGRVSGAKPGQRIVLFAKAGLWWVQPFNYKPYTDVINSQWKGLTHPGTAYAALLVAPGYKPPSTSVELPQKSASVLAVAIADSVALRQPPVHKLRFSGYEWRIREGPYDPGGSRNLYSPDNAVVDPRGFLHLRITQRAGHWTSGEVVLSRSLGYGSYRFLIQDVGHFDPAVVLNLSVEDDSGQLREMNIETSRWGEPHSKNAQYVIQPFYVPANVSRFTAPSGMLTHSLLWEPGRASFETARNTASQAKGSVISRHVFTSGVPAPGGDAIHMNLYAFDNRDHPIQHDTEVTIEKFEYLP